MKRANKSTDILVFGLPSYGDGSPKRTQFMFELKRLLREKDPLWNTTLYFFSDAEQAAEHIEKCPSLELVYVAARPREDFDDVVCDMGPIASAIYHHKHDPWVVLHPEVEFLKEGALGGWGVLVDVAPLCEVVVRRWEHEQREEAMA